MSFENATKDIEIGRVQVWLAGAIELIESNNCTISDTTCLEKRKTIVQLLQQYRHNGVFPRQPSRRHRMPCFIDQARRPCAIAFLLQSTGSEELAQRIACESNSEFVADMRSSLAIDTWNALAAWLNSVASLSVEEAMRVQPTYAYDRDSDDAVSERTMAVLKAQREALENLKRRRCCACALL